MAAKDSLLWKYVKGPAQAQSEFDDPTVDATLALCLYAGATPALVKQVLVPPGGTCDGKNCWKPLGTKGYKFTDKSAEHSGAFKIQLKSDATTAKSKVLVKGRGAELAYFEDDTLPLSEEGPASVRLVNSSNSTCWGADFNSVIKNDGSKFIAKFP